MNEQDVIDLVNQWIVENNNNEITANVLNPVLIAMIQQPNLLIGDLGDLSTGENDNIVDAINWILTQISSGGITIHVGQNNPNDIPPVTYIVGDFYSQLDVMNNPLYLWQYTGTEWARISNYIDDSIESEDTTWSSHKISEAIKGDRLEGNPTIVLDENEITISGLSWWIQGTPYILIPPFNDTIPYTSALGFSRKDIIVAVQSNNLVRIAGDEGTGIVQPPQVPENTLLVTPLDVYHDSVGEPTEPILGDEYIPKASEGWFTYLLNSANPEAIPTISTPFNINFQAFVNDHIVRGLNITSAASKIWNGGMIAIRNNSDYPVLINHLDTASTAKILFDFPSGEDFLLRKEDGVKYFKLSAIPATGVAYAYCLNDFVAGGITATQVSYDDTITQLGETNVQSIIEAIVRRGIIKLEESLVFEVGYDKQFTSVSSAIEKALEYYPNEDYTVTILIDEGFEIEENLSYVNTDFSHIILSTTGEVTIDASLTGRLFNFENCWLPVIKDFEITGNYVMTHFIFINKCFAYSDSNLKVKGFLTSIAISSSFSSRSDNSEISVPAINNTRGYNIQNSYFRMANTKIISENTSALSVTTYAVLGNALSNLVISGGASEISGNFRRGVVASSASFGIGATPIQSMEYDVFIENGGVVNDTLNLNRTSNAVKNVQTTNGLYLNRNFPIPYNFDGTDYILDYIKADEGEEFVVTVDEDGKLKSVNALPADQVSYDNTASGLEAETVQEAVDEVQGNVEQEATDRQLAIETAGFIQRTGTAIAFDKWATYGTYAAPVSGNLSYSFADMVKGMIQVMYHQASTPPTTTQVGVVKTETGDYVVDRVNKITIHCVDEDVIEITIKTLE